MQESPDRALIDDPGHWLETECQALGVSVHRVAIEARLSPSTVQRWVKGETTPYWQAFERVRIVVGRIRDEKESFWRGRRGA